MNGTSRSRGLSQRTILLLLIAFTVLLLVLLLVTAGLLQERAESDVIGSLPPPADLEATKILAEIEEIRSNTRGSLFLLKVVTLLLSITGAVAGYLVAQDRATQTRIEFEKQKGIDEAYQAIVQDLAAGEPLLRAAAAIRLGSLLQSFPEEWDVGEERINQIKRRTKQILAACLAIERDPKVLKTLTIALVLREKGSQDLPDLREIDLSGAMAEDAYWARVDFEGADFYKARLAQASLRKARLKWAQFRESDLRCAVLAGADCEEADFKMADLREADFSGANLQGASFEEAKVSGLLLAEATLSAKPDHMVDVSPAGDGSQRIPVTDWLNSKSHSTLNGTPGDS